MVPIFSLPQEWLWCESWCSNAGLAAAKTVDLCNNPRYKEPKLSMAQRVIAGPLFSESWLELDAEIALAESTWNAEMAKEHTQAHDAVEIIKNADAARAAQLSVQDREDSSEL